VKAEGSQVPGQPELHSETLFQKERREREREKKEKKKERKKENPPNCKKELVLIG
jgi:hypothetical protein